MMNFPTSGRPVYIQNAVFSILAVLSGFANNASAAEPSLKEVENKEWEARCMEVYAAMIDRLDQKILMSLMAVAGRTSVTRCFENSNTGLMKVTSARR